MTKTCIAIVALLGVCATNVVVAAPTSGPFVPKTATAVTKVGTHCVTQCSGPSNNRTCYTNCN
jgi:hypothetical protein